MFYQNLIVEPRFVEMIDDTIFEWQAFGGALIGPAIKLLQGRDQRTFSDFREHADLASVLLSDFAKHRHDRFENMPSSLKRNAAWAVLGYITRSAPNDSGGSEEAMLERLLSRYLARPQELLVNVEIGGLDFAERSRTALRLKLLQQSSHDWVSCEFRLGERRERPAPSPITLMVASKGIRVTLRSTSGRKPSAELASA